MLQYLRCESIIVKCLLLTLIKWQLLLLPAEVDGLPLLLLEAGPQLARQPPHRHADLRRQGRHPPGGGGGGEVQGVGVQVDGGRGRGVGGSQHGSATRFAWRWTVDVWR